MGTINRYGLWFPTEGPGSVFEIMQPLGMGGATEPFGGRATVYVNGPNGDFIPYALEETPPSGQPDTNFTFFQKAQINKLEMWAQRRRTFHMQRRYNPCASVDNPSGWERIWHFTQGIINSRQLPEGPPLRAAGNLTESGVAVSFQAVIDVVRISLSDLTTAETQNVTCIDGLKDEKVSCAGGYPGGDKIMYAGCAAATGAAANVLYTANGGGAWAAMAAKPFGNDVDISKIAVRPIGSRFRVVVAPGTAGTNLQIACADEELGNEGAGTWTTKTVESGNAADTVTALGWLDHNRMYLGTSAGAIWLSSDQGESWTKLYDDGANAVNAFAIDGDKNVYAVGANNLIVREMANNRGVFAARTGPSGAAASTSIAVANDGIIYIGNGTKVYRNNNAAQNAGGWTVVKDFGTGYSAIGIELEGKHKLAGGDSELLRVFVDHATAGLVAESVDGGASWRTLDSLTNAGYNGVYASKYGNHYVVVGDATGGAGIIQLLAQ
ncbi:MAG: hypothetical protein FOGNACKC_00921 [Anaerolineae bacterium]|nr:hypothetical protein [Anaerolineae bacterium]